MFERRPIVGLLIGLTLCISIWRITVQEPSLYATEIGHGNQMPYDVPHPLPTASELRQTQQELPTTQQQKHRYQYRTSYAQRVAQGLSHPHAFDGENNTLSFVNFTPSLPTNLLQTYAYETLPANDSTTLIDLKNFKFLISQMPCSPRNTPYFLILIHSAPLNHVKRQVVRDTWGSVQSPHLRLLFLVGTVASEELQQSLENENSRFSDLIQGNFVDDYRNMTYKHVMALKWFIYYCPEAKFLIKTDDDVFVNTLQLLEYVELQQQQSPILSPFTPRTYHVPSSSNNISDSLSPRTSHILKALQSKNFLFCQMQTGSRVKRSYRSKWRVSHQEFAGRYYPTYCPGYAIMYSPDVVFQLYGEAQHAKYFWIDDVHITGTLAQRANITITSFTDFRILKPMYVSFLNRKRDIGKYTFFFSWANIKEQEIRGLWALTLNYFNTTRSNSGAVYKFDSFR